MQSRPNQKLFYHVLKRLFDIVFSTIVIVVLFIPSLALMAIIALDTKGSPLYMEERIGKGGKPFKIYKFRTMVPDANDVKRYFNAEQLRQWRQERKVDNDPRITRVGSFLRKTSLDELPQFLNVLVGSMSIVGPRPIVSEELSWFSDMDRQAFLSVRPGITGYWQVQARNEATFENGFRKEFELYYIDHPSIIFDLLIILKTISVICRRTGK